MRNERPKIGKAGVPVALHDVSVLTFGWAEGLVAELLSLGASPALMVVPAPEGGEEVPAERRAAFSAWLRECAAAGLPLFCHGRTHRADPSAPRSSAGRIQNRLNADEAEFAGLPEEELAARLDGALEAFDGLGCGAPAGFVPPTWFAPRALERLLFARGVGLCERRLRISRPAMRLSSFPISLFGGSRAAWALSASCAELALAPRAPFLAAFFALARAAARPRLALHPVDFADDGRRARMEALLRRVAEGLGFAPYF